MFPCKGKVVLVLNWAPRHEDKWGSGGIAPHIPNLRTDWRLGVSSTPRLLYPPVPNGYDAESVWTWWWLYLHYLTRFRTQHRFTLTVAAASVTPSRYGLQAIRSGADTSHSLHLLPSDKIIMRSARGGNLFWRLQILHFQIVITFQLCNIAAIVY